MRNQFQAAVQMHRQGRLLQAERVYRKLLQQFPGQPDVLNALGMLLGQRGALAEALSTFRKALKADSSAVHVYLNLAQALQASGKTGEAAATLERALKIKPDFAEAWFFLGNVLHDQQRLEAAIDCYHKVLDLLPTFAPVHNCLGVALQESRRLPEAIQVLQGAIRIQPNSAEAHLNLANTYYKSNEKNLAQEHYAICLRITPQLPQAHLGLAQLGLDSLVVSADNDKAIEAHLAAAKPLSHTPEYMSAMGIYDARKGNWDASNAMLLKSLRLRPDTNTLYQYVKGTKFAMDDAEIAGCISLLMADAGKLDLESRALLYFARAKMLNDIKSYSEAFGNYEEGNRLVNQTKNYIARDIDESVDRLIGAFGRELFEKVKNPVGGASEKLIFIVGMPRSGTTLTEQVIASHPLVLGAGELFGMVALEERLPQLVRSARSYPELVSDLTPDDLERIASSYLKEIDDLFPGDHQRVTDKFPLNFWRLGLISLLFPETKIIHVKRDPLDCCLSNYFQKFADGHDFAFDLGNLGHYHRACQRLMAHWQAVLPTQIFDLQYENLTADPEYWSRALIDFVGLDWDDACLQPHQLNRSVRTASVWQVRQPIYKTSVQRWKYYEQHLGPLKQALGLEA